MCGCKHGEGLPVVKRCAVYEFSKGKTCLLPKHILSRRKPIFGKTKPPVVQERNICPKCDDLVKYCNSKEKLKDALRKDTSITATYELLSEIWDFLRDTDFDKEYANEGEPEDWEVLKQSRPSEKRDGRRTALGDDRDDEISRV